MPPIAGANAADMHRAMIEFREGQRPATVMHQITKGYSNDELRRIAEYFSKQKR